MKSLLIGCLLLLFAVTAAGAAEKNLVELHKNAGKMTNKECLACHAKIKTDVSLNKKYKPFHGLDLHNKSKVPGNYLILFG